MTKTTWKRRRSMAYDGVMTAYVRDISSRRRKPRQGMTITNAVPLSGEPLLVSLSRAVRT